MGLAGAVVVFLWWGAGAQGQTVRGTTAARASNSHDPAAGLSPAADGAGETAAYVVTPPADQVAALGGSVTFSVVAGGTPPLAYQWRFNGTDLSGATNASLVLTNVQPTDNGVYTVAVSNAFGVALSAEARLRVMGLPEALNATNLVWVSPTTPPWFAQSTLARDGFAAAAVPATSLAWSDLQTTVSGPATLGFWWGLSGNVEFHFLVDGTRQAPREVSSAFSWHQAVVDLPAGLHVVTWRAMGASWASSNDTVFLDQVSWVPGATPAAITTQPASQSRPAGSNVTFSVVAAGTPPLSYQWAREGVDLPGATNASLALADVQTPIAGSYRVRVSNDSGQVLSLEALLTVTPAAPVFTTQPAGAGPLVGSPTTLAATAIGSSPIAYQWLRNGAPVSGATNPVLTLPAVQPAEAGTYSLRASNAVGTATSSNALVSPYTVVDLGATLGSGDLVWNTTNVPWFPQTNITHDGISAAQTGLISGRQRSTLDAVATGPATLRYWWKVNCNDFWVNLGFSLNGTLQNGIGGSVDWQAVTNYLGAGAQLLRWELYPKYNAIAGGTGWLDQVQIEPGSTAPRVAVQPASSTVAAGDTVSLSAAAIGTPPLRYQWRHDGTAVVGATNATLSLTNVQTDLAGVYDSVVTNDLGAVVSAPATLTVAASAPAITAQPTSQSSSLNGSASFSVTAKGSDPLHFQWRRNGAELPGATLPLLSLTGLRASQAGDYTVVVANALGAVTSLVARLEVSTMVVVECWPFPLNRYAAPSGLGDLTAIAAGELHTAGLRRDGTVACWGTGGTVVTNVPAGLSNVTALAAGNAHTIALKSDGTVVAWGNNTYGQLLVPPGLSNVTAVAAAANHTLALRRDGTVVGWGNNAVGQVSIPVGLSNVEAIAASVYNGFAVRTDGTLVQWGNLGNTPFVVEPTPSGIATLAAGGSAAWGLQNNGRLRNWGYSIGSGILYGEYAALAGSGRTSSEDYPLVLSYAGTVSTALASDTPGLPANLSNVVGLAAGYRHAALLVNDGSPRGVSHPLNRTVPGGSTVTFAAGIVGANPIHYQWQFNGADLAGATNRFLTLSNVTLEATGRYRCLALNDLGGFTNQDAGLTVLRSSPAFAAAPVVSENGALLRLDQLSGHGPTILYASPNLRDWLPIATNPPTAGTFEFFDPSAPNAPARFYRVAEQ